VVDGGYRLARHGKLYWLDNERVLFYGRSAKQDSRGAGKAASNPTTGGTYIWNIATGALEHVSEWEITCYHPEYSTWSLVRPAKNEFRFKAGKFGQETELPREDLTVQQRMERVRSDFTCKTHLRSELSPPALRDHNVIVLQDGQSYVDLGPGLGANLSERRAFPRNLALYQAKTVKALTLPLTWEESFSPFEVAYSKYRDAYVLRPRAPRGAPIGLSQPWPKNQDLVVYLLWENGRVETKLLPYWPAEYLIDPRPSRTGWIFGGGKLRHTGGLYLFDGKAVSKLDAGFVKEISVAEDGCKAAVGIQNRPDEMGTPINLKVFDLCVGRQ
jgi:hypothetical protein